MQVDTAQLRKAAARLRHEVIPQLKRGKPRLDDLAGNGFDSPALWDAYSQTSAAWLREVDVLVRAAEQLADSLESAAADYDRSDEHAARRMTVHR